MLAFWRLQSDRRAAAGCRHRQEQSAQRHPLRGSGNGGSLLPAGALQAPGLCCIVPHDLVSSLQLLTAPAAYNKLQLALPCVVPSPGLPK